MEEADLDWLLVKFISFGDQIEPDDLRKAQDIVAACKAMLAGVETSGD